MEMAVKGDIKPENLPHTESTAINHSLRVHQQTITWETLAATTPNPLQWEWKKENRKLTPTQTDENVAPSELLKFIRCNCKSLNNMCPTNQCTCKRCGLKCVAACGKCRGEACENNEKVIDINQILNVSPFCTEKYKHEFINIDRACEVNVN